MMQKHFAAHERQRGDNPQYREITFSNVNTKTTRFIAEIDNVSQISARKASDTNCLMGSAHFSITYMDVCPDSPSANPEKQSRPLTAHKESQGNSYERPR